VTVFERGCPIMLPCPSEATLKSFGINAPSDATYAAIEEHVEACAQCQAALERLVRAGSVSPVALPDSGEWPHIPGFEIERELGRGAMSVVYQAWQPSLRRRVALKIVRSGPSSGSRERARWLREARAFTCVRHPNVVALYDAGEAGPWLYLVLEYVPGGSLRHWLDIPYAAIDAARLLETIARAVAAIHAEGLVHLDLKPSNILLDGDPHKPREGATPRVGDFGIAMRWNGPDASLATHNGAGPVGTPSYMAPEQVKGDRAAIGPASDVYGLGALLYHLLTGRPPFSAASVADTLDQVRNQEPVPPRRLIRQIPRELETIVLKCLQKSPAGRYASAEAVASDLRSWLDGRPISARRVSPVEKGWRWCRRRPAISALAAMLMLTLSVAFVSVVVLWRRAEADYQMAVDMTGDLTDLIAGGEYYIPRTMTVDRVIQGLGHHRPHLVALAARRPDDLRLAHRLLLIESGLSFNLMQAHRHEEARMILLESLQRTDDLIQRHPSGAGLRRDQRECLDRLIAVSERLGKFDECTLFHRRIIRWCEEELRRAPNADTLVSLIVRRRSLAWFLHGRGHREQAASLFAANRHALEHPPAGCAGPSLLAERLLSHIDSMELLSDVPSVTSRRSGNDTSNALSRPASPMDASQSSRDWAAVAAQAVRSGDPDPHAAARDEAAGGRAVVDGLSAHVFRLRRLRHLDGARLVTDRMLALARHLVVSHPDQPNSHLALSQAYRQMYKNAYDSDDQSAVEANMRFARDAAEAALRLAPGNEIVRQEVEDLGRRLAELPLKTQGK
jgi:eukaryotic-like serine/threonine-protein kinase